VTKRPPQALAQFERVIEKLGSARAVAQTLNVSEATVSRIRSGERGPGRRIASLIRKHYSIPVDAWDAA
jgi:transcriptional regulator with XRE-family HTH domain